MLSLSSVFLICFTTLTLATIPGASIESERVWLALHAYDAQSSKSLVYPGEDIAPIRGHQWRRRFLYSAMIVPELFVFVTAGKTFGPITGFLKSHVADYYLLLMLGIAIEKARCQERSALVSRSIDKLNRCQIVPDGTTKSYLPSMVFIIGLPGRTITVKVHATVMIGLALLSIICGWPHGLTAFVAFYLGYNAVIAPPKVGRDGSQSFQSFVWMPVIALGMVAVTQGIPYLLVRMWRYFSSAATADPVESPVQSGLERWAEEWIKDKSVGDLFELCISASLPLANFLSMVLLVLIYRYDRKQSAKQSAQRIQLIKYSNADGNASNAKYSSEDVDSSGPSSNFAVAKDAHGRVPVPLGSTEVSPVSWRELPSFTAALLALVFVHVAVLLTTLLSESVRDPSEPVDMGMGRAAVVDSSIVFLILAPLSFTVVIGASLVAASSSSTAGAAGLWKYTEYWSFSHYGRDEEAQ